MRRHNERITNIYISLFIFHKFLFCCDVKAAHQYFTLVKVNIRTPTYLTALIHANISDSFNSSNSSIHDFDHSRISDNSEEILILRLHESKLLGIHESNY